MAGIAVENIASGLIREWGFVESGTFEVPTGYREIVLTNPPTAEEMEPPSLPIAQQMEALFRGLPVDVRALFAGLRAEIKVCVDLSPIDWELIQYRIENTPVPAEYPELASLKTALLALIPEEE